MKFRIFLFTLVSLIVLKSSVFVPVALAHCPLCVAGAAAGVTLTRWVGIDDSITGVWIGALLGSISFWIYGYLVGRKIKWLNKYRKWLKPVIYILIFASTLWSFYAFKLVIRMSQIMGIDKLTFGMVAGAAAFYLIDLVKIKHYFPYQRIVISLGSMAVISLAIYILINYYI